MTDSLNRAMMRAREQHDTSSIVAGGDGLVSIALLKSPAYRCMTKSAHLILARVTIELANGRNAITHCGFQKFGIARDSVTAAVAEVEALGLIRVGRRTAHASEGSMRFYGAS
jgi:hypothetical protein